MKNIVLPCNHESESLEEDCLCCSKYTEDEKFKKLCKELNDKRLKIQLPNIIQRTENLINAGVKYIAAGMPQLLMEELVKERLKACESCVDNKDGVCVGIDPKTQRACGCIISAKTKIPTEDCPVGKWPRINLSVVSNKGCGGCGKTKP